MVAPDGQTVVADSIAGAAADASSLGKELAGRLLRDGAEEILEAVYG